MNGQGKGYAKLEIYDGLTLSRSKMAKHFNVDHSALCRLLNEGWEFAEALDDLRAKRRMTTDLEYYTQILDRICRIVKEKNRKAWASFSQGKKIEFIKLGRYLERDRLGFDDFKLRRCTRCGEERLKMPKQRTICYRCCHELYDRKTLKVA